jgi:phosphoribosyl 1,2-cyclic phosphate phosphodiesterase
LYTHAHADHIYGIDDLRRFNQLQKERIPVYGSEQTLQRLARVFDYAFGNGSLIPGLPNLQARIISGPFRINDLQIIPLKLFHGEQEILGFRIADMAYCTDVSAIPPESYRHLGGLKILILDALRHASHPTHFSLTEAIAEAQKIAAAKTYFIHMAHKIEHEADSRLLPEQMHFACDGQILIL